MVDQPSLNELKSRIKDLEAENSHLQRQLAQSRSNEHQFRAMIENVPEIIWMISPETLRTIYLSPSVETMLGYSVEEARKKSVKEMVTPASFKFATRYLADAIEKMKTDPALAYKHHSFEVEYICKDGTTLWAELTAKMVADENGKTIGIIGVSRDISQRLVAENALKKSEEKYRTLFENSRDAIYITSLAGRIVEMNPAGIDLFGFPKSEMIDADIIQIYDNPMEREIFQAKIAEKGYVRDYEITFKKKDGTRIDCLLTSTFWYSETSEKIGYQGIIRDITEQKRMMKQFQQIQKMEAIGTLAGGIAHNFNNLLMTIQGNTSLMLMKTDPAHPHYKKLRTIEQHIQHGSDLSRQLLGFARGGQHESKSVNLNLVAKMSSKIFAATKKELSVHFNLAPDLRPILADPGQIEQTLLNLLVNASQAMPDGGDITIATENIHLDQFQLAHYQSDFGQYVKISVTDTGLGIDKAIQEKIFEPFFTTKEHGQGTGLGLSSVYGIVKNHRGYITVYSEPGKGSTFNIYLPAADRMPAKEKKDAPVLLRGEETILIVDDEPMLIETGETLLTELGYTVLTASDGQAAVETYAARAGDIDLVILDLIMPKMSGKTTFAELRKLNPAIKVLVSSGYGINGQVSDLLNSGCQGFIQKPFGLAKLSEQVRQALDSGTL